MPLADAAAVLWGPAGAYAYAAYGRFRHQLFPELPTSLPIVIGLTAYGHCVGLTRPLPMGARISLAPTIFRQGEGMVDDVLLHEMLHVWLLQAGEDHKHASDAWYGAVRRLSPAVLGHELDVSRPRRRSVRVPNPAHGPHDPRRTLVRKRPADDEGMHASVARWPVTFRPPGYDFGAPIVVSTY